MRFICLGAIMVEMDMEENRLWRRMQGLIFMVLGSRSIFLGVGRATFYFLPLKNSLNK